MAAIIKVIAACAGLALGMCAIASQISSGPNNAVAAVKNRMEGIRIVSKVETKPIPYKIRYEISRTVGVGRVAQSTSGKDGKLTRTYSLIFRGNRLVEKKLVSSEREPPVDKLMLMGRGGFATSRGSFTRGRVMTVSATAYDPTAGRGRAATMRTATGRRAGYGLIAVDPRVIPLGTFVFVEGYGLALAADTGGAIKGRKIDLGVPTVSAAMRWGRRKVRIHLLGR